MTFDDPFNTENSVRTQLLFVLPRNRPKQPASGSPPGRRPASGRDGTTDPVLGYNPRVDQCPSARDRAQPTPIRRSAGTARGGYPPDDTLTVDESALAATAYDREFAS